MQAAEQSYGATPPAVKANMMFLRGRRKRMNLAAICQCILLPWILFSVVSAVMTFEIRHTHPEVSWVIAGLFGVLVLICGVLAFRTWRAKRREAEDYEPTWYFFLFFAMLLAWILAIVSGEYNFTKHVKVSVHLDHTSTYGADLPSGGVNVATTLGVQLMDAGKVIFAPGTTLDFQHSLGFKNGKIYCVAPITVGTLPLGNYDFWAIGTNCCSGKGGDFHCDEFNNPNAHGGIRLMSEEDRPYYRLAVQQAEATYNIKATHPLFFHWVEDPERGVQVAVGRTGSGKKGSALSQEELKSEASSHYLMFMCTYFSFNTFCVVVVAIAFSKIGFY